MPPAAMPQRGAARPRMHREGRSGDAATAVGRMPLPRKSSCFQDGPGLDAFEYARLVEGSRRA